MIKLLTNEEIKKNKYRIAEIYREVFNLKKDSEEFLVYRIDNSIENGLNTKILVAMEESEIVGFLFGFDFREENWWAQQIENDLPKVDFNWYENTFELNELAVLEKYRKNGYGKQLMKKLIEDKSYHRILLGTAKENNENVLRFYYSLGFKDLINPFYYENAEYSTSIIMIHKK